jgi:hypothetical protein
MERKPISEEKGTEKTKRGHRIKADDNRME